MKAARSLQHPPESDGTLSTANSRLALQHQFDLAPPSAAFDQKTISVVLDVSTALLEKWRWNGQGPQFLKIGSRCRYRKQDILDFLDARFYRSTSVLGSPDV